MTRVVTAIVLIAAVIALIFFGQQWMIALAACGVAELAAFEYVALADAAGVRIPRWWMLPSIAAMFLFTLPGFHYDALLPLLSLLGLALLAVAAFRGELARVLPDSAAGLFGLVYVGFPLTLLPMLWNRDDGKPLLLFLMVAVWAGDIAALYVGRALGRHPLSRLSPKKTWEGAIASVAGSVLAGLAVVLAGERLSARGNTLLHIVEPVWATMLLAALVNVAAQLGDLLESAIKRGAGVKDSGALLPGHGGILDRIDALLAAAPVLWAALLVKDALSLGRF